MRIGNVWASVIIPGSWTAGWAFANWLRLIVRRWFRLQRLLDSCEISDPAGVRDYANSCWSQAWACDRLRRRGRRSGRLNWRRAAVRKRPPASSTTAYSHVMNWSDPTKAYAVPRSIALRDQVYAPQGVTGESCVIEG